MKKLFLFSGLLIFALSMSAQLRDAAERMDIARSILQTDDAHRVNGKNIVDAYAADDIRVLCTSAQLFSDSNVYMGLDAGEPRFYVYGYANGAPGYVIVSADKDAHEVLGFSTTSFFDYEQLPEAAQDLLLHYARSVANGEMSSSDVTHESTMRKAAATTVDPLLGDIAFNQAAPFNGKCPLYNNQRCVVGCSGTAMAQIMAFYQHPKRMNTSNGGISYTTTTNKIYVNWNVTGTTFDWANTLDVYSAKTPVWSSSDLYSDTGYFTFENVELQDGSDNILVTNFKNVSGKTFTGNVALLLKDSKGTVRGYASVKKTMEDLYANYYYKTYYMTPVIDASLADGEYKVYLATQYSSGGKWSAASRTGGQDSFLKLTKKGSTFTLLGKQFHCGYNDTQANAVATLCAACSSSLFADFGVNQTSGTFSNMGLGLINYMDYSDRMILIEPAYLSTQAWHDYIQNEVASKRPVFVSGHALKSNLGHAFVIDGYTFKNKVPYYHVNWGWGGMSNGYFLIDNLKPTNAGVGGASENYSDELHLVTNIRPKYDSKESNQLAATQISLGSTSLKTGDKLLISVDGLCNKSFSDITSSKVMIYAADANGKDYEMGTFMNIRDLLFNYRYNNLSLQVQIPKSIPTGDYTIELRSLDSGRSIMTTVLSPSNTKVHITNPTPITDITAEQAKPAVRYDLGGRKDSGTGTRIVIVNGRKVVVRK